MFKFYCEQSIAFCQHTSLFEENYINFLQFFMFETFLFQIILKQYIIKIQLFNTRKLSILLSVQLLVVLYLGSYLQVLITKRPKYFMYIEDIFSTLRYIFVHTYAFYALFYILMQICTENKTMNFLEQCEGNYQKLFCIWHYNLYFKTHFKIA